MSDLPAFLAKDLEAVRVLGEGSFGVVHEVRRRRDGERLALKLIPVRGDGEREKREIMATLMVSHPRVIRCEGAGVEEQVAWLLLEFAEGTLAESIGEPEHMAQDWKHLRQACEGVHALHQAGMVHRDLKPSNILLTPEGAKVSDLGLTKGGDLRTLTKQGLVMGTPGYLAPEQARGEKLTAAADIFALGVMFYQVVEGGLPYPDDTAIGLIQRVSKGDVRDFARARDFLPGDVLANLRAALDPDPLRRPQDALAWSRSLGKFRKRTSGAIAHTLSNTGTGQLPAATVVSRVSPHPDAGTSRGRRGAALLAGGLGLLVAGSFLLSGPGDPADLRWRTVGDAVVVEFSGGDPAATRLQIDGELRNPAPTPVEGGYRLVADALRPDREVTARLRWGDEASEPMPLTPGRPALSRNLRLAAGRKVILEAHRDCDVYLTEGGEPRRLKAGVTELSLPGEGLGPWVLGWTDEGVRFRHEFRPEEVAGRALERLERTIGGVDVPQVIEERFMSRMIQASMRKELDREFWGEDPLLPERAAWKALDGWLPDLLESPLSRERRARLFELWREWFVYVRLDNQLVGEPQGIEVPRSRAGALHEGLPDWAGARVVPLEAALPVRMDTLSGGNLVTMMSGRSTSDARRSRVLELTWPDLGVSGRTPVAFCLRGTARRWFRYRLSDASGGTDFALYLWRDDHTVPRFELLDDKKEMYRRQREAWDDPEPTWISATLPADLWPAPGTRLRMEFQATLSNWPASGRVDQLQLVVADGS